VEVESSLVGCVSRSVEASHAAPPKVRHARCGTNATSAAAARHPTGGPSAGLQRAALAACSTITHAALHRARRRAHTQQRHRSS
jgi:hypothetical protein